MELPGLQQALNVLQGPTLTLNTGRLPSQILQLQVGETLLAMVINASVDGQVTLSIKNNLLLAQTNLRLQEGQSLTLTVAETGKQTVLKLAQPALEAEVLMQALRQSFPKQQPLQPLLTALRELTQQAAMKAPTQQDTAAKTPTLSETPSETTSAAPRPSDPNHRSAGSTDARPPAPEPGAKPPVRPPSTVPAPAETTNDEISTANQQPAARASVSVNTARLFMGLQPRPGEHFTAKVINVKTDGTATLSLNHQIIKTKVPPRALSAGQTVPLRVTSTTADSTMLVVELPAVTPAKQSPTNGPDTQKIRGASDGVKAETANAPERPRPPIRPALTQLAKELFGTLATRQQLTTPEGLKRALLDSGLFFENSLAKSVKDNVRNFRFQDFKAGLLRLVDQVKGQVREGPRQNTPAAERIINADLQQVADLAAKGESALSRVHTNQIASLMATDDGKSVLVADLPVRHEGGTEVVHFRIEREPRRNSDNEATHPYTVTLSFDIGDLGPMHARILVMEQQVSVGLWAENVATVELVNRHLPDLGERLEQVGLNPGNLGCQKGRPNVDDNPPLPRGLLDIEA